ITWRPTWDWRALLLLLWVAAVLLGFRTLARASGHPTVRIISLVICLSLFALGVYVTPAESLSSGMFGRVASSPFWSRTARLVLIAVPLCVWCRTFELSRCWPLSHSPRNKRAGLERALTAAVKAARAAGAVMRKNFHSSKRINEEQQRDIKLELDVR